MGGVDRRVLLFFKTREQWTVCILFGLAFAVRLYMVFHTYLITNDGILYVRLAKLISKGEFGAAFSISFFNLYPFVIALFQKIFNEWELSGQLVSMVFGSLTLIPLYFLTKSLFSRTAAMVSSVLFVFHPHLVRFSAEVIRGPIFWFFFVMALWIGWKAICERKAWQFFLTSLLGALSFLFRAEGVVIVPIVAVWMHLKDREAPHLAVRRRIYLTLILLLTVPALFSPALFYLKSKTGRWHLARIDEIPGLAFSDVTMESIKANFHRVDVKPWDDSPQGELKVIRLRQFLSLAKDHRIGIVVLEMVSTFQKGLHPLLLVLLFFGVIKRKSIRYQSREEFFLLSVLVGLFFILLRYGTVTYYIGTRHMMVPAILSLPWAGAGVMEVEHRIRSAFLKGRTGFARILDARNMACFLIIAIVCILLPKTLAPQRVDKIPMKEAGLWIKEHGPSNPVIMAQGGWRRLVFYADGTFLEIPRGRDIYEYAKTQRVDFLAINEEDVETTHPGLIHSLNPWRFKKEVVLGEPPGPYVIRVYSVKG
jgi:hypothetical protein